MSSPYPSELRKVTEKEKPYMEKLTSDDINSQWEAVIDIRNAIIGSRRQKANFIVMGKVITIIKLISSLESEYPNYPRTKFKPKLAKFAKR